MSTVATSEPKDGELEMKVGPAVGPDVPVIHFTITEAGKEPVFLGWVNPSPFPTHMTVSLNADSGQSGLKLVQLYRGEVDASFYGIDPETVGLSINKDDLTREVRFSAPEFWNAFDQATS